MLSIVATIIGCLCHLINVNNDGIMATLSSNENNAENGGINGENLFPIYSSSSSDSTAEDTMMIKSNKNNINFDNYESINSLLPIVSSSSSSSSMMPIKIETRGAEKQHYCGENLIKALALYCKGYYANKRTSGLSKSINPIAEGMVLKKKDLFLYENRIN